MKSLKRNVMAFAIAGMAAPAFAAPFSSYDSNDDGSISKDEFYGSVADIGIYPSWDLNEAGLLDDDEFAEFGDDWDYDTWDANTDRSVDRGEFYDGYYASYDANKDGHWDNGEWDDAGEAGLFDW